MARIALAGFLHETNTFSPIPTDYNSFADRSALLCGIYAGEELAREFQGKNLNNAVCGFWDVAESLGHEVVPLVRIGEAEPSGTIPEELFFQLLDLIIKGLSEQGPFDAVFLDLHGAMVYGNFQPGEPEILRRVRQVVGNIPVVTALDLHGNISQESIDLSSAMVGYRTYPHIDILETGQRCAYLIDHLLAKKPLYKAYRQFPFLMPGSTQATNHDPCQSLYAMIDEVEKNPEVISATIMEGFGADLEFAGPTTFAFAVTQKAADEAVERIMQHALEHEKEYQDNLPDAREAVRQAILLASTASKPVILADIQDNPGGGGTSDTVWILEELVRQNAPDSAVALIYDPETAQIAHTAGKGAQITIDLGGKLQPGQKPFHGTFKVEELFEGEFLGAGPVSFNMKINLGKMAHLRIGNVRVVVACLRTQAHDQSYMRQVGIDPTKMKILALKSSNHYRADFEPISSGIINVAAPGALINNPIHITYQRLREGVRLQGLGPANHCQKSS